MVSTFKLNDKTQVEAWLAENCIPFNVSCLCFRAMCAFAFRP